MIWFQTANWLIYGLASRGNSVTAPNESDGPLKSPARCINPVALMESCSFMVVFSLPGL